MHSPLYLPFALLLSLLEIHPTYALKLPFEGRTVTYPHNSSLQGRADISGSSDTNSNGVPVANAHNAQYIANITLGGKVTPVLLDTGSSDLWVNFQGDIPETKDMGKSLTLSYAVGQAKGNVKSIQLEFDGHTVSDQAFLLVTNTSSFSSDIHAQGYDGLLGLGPNAGSVIFDKIDSSAGDTMLNRIFTQNKSTDKNYISFLLDRLGDPTPTFTGQFTVSELASGLENITSMPKLEIDMLHKVLESDQHWQILSDKDVGIKGPDGEYIKVDSIVPSAPDGQLVVVIDSGFTFSQVPRDVSDAIYGRVKGAVYDEKNQYWTVPCGQLLEISFSFGGKVYPVHPLDVVNDNFNIQDKNGNTVCIGTFQPITSAFSLLGNYDMILGMSFLRNTYTLLNFGEWVDNGGSKDDPYVQLLSVTNAAEAHADFVTARLNGVDTSSSDTYALLPADQMQHSPVSDEEKKKRYQEMVLSRWPYIFIGCLVFVLLVIGLIIWKCCCKRRSKKNSGNTDFEGGEGGKKGFFSRQDENSSYLQLQAKGGASSASLTGSSYGESAYANDSYGHRPGMH